MISKQESTSSCTNSLNSNKIEKILCFNPDCRIIQNRFSLQNQIKLHQECAGWIVNMRDINRLLINAQNFQQSQTPDLNDFDFKFSPLKSLYEMKSVFGMAPTNQFSEKAKQSPSLSKPIELLKVNLGLIKNKIQNELARIFHQISDRIEKIQQIQTQTVSEINNILLLNDIQQIQSTIKRSAPLKNYKEFCKAADSFKIINQEKITKQIFQIFQSIQSIGKSFWNTELESFKRQRDILQNAKRNIENYHQDESIHPNLKIQNLANIFQTRNSIQPFVLQDKMSAYLTCWICQKDCYGKGSNIKQHKAEASRNLINHLMASHREQTMFKFTGQIMKTALHKINFVELIAEIQEKNYSQFVIIDRENSNKGIEEHISNKVTDKTFIVNVLSSQNQKKIAAGKYILANSTAKDSADTLMIMIIHSIINSGFYRLTSHFYPEKIPKIILLTKDHFASTLKEILKNDFNVEIQIVK